MEAEAKGVAFTEFEAKENKKSKRSKATPKTTAKTVAAPTAPTTRAAAGKKRTAAEIEEAEVKELAKIMMTNKQQKLYSKIQYGKDKKAAEVEKLTRRKEQLVKDSKAASKKKARK